MSSFIAVTIITILVAAVPASFEAIQCYRVPKMRHLIHPHAMGQECENGTCLDQRSYGSCSDTCLQLLVNLSDLQALTSLAIVSAAWVQISTLSFYHQQLVSSYWWLTLTSHWICRRNFLRFRAEDDRACAGTRQTLITVSYVLGLAYQGYILRYQYPIWDDIGGPCYRYKDGSTTIIWIIGESFFAIGLLVTFSRSGRKLSQTYHRWLNKIGLDLTEWQSTTRDDLKSLSNRHHEDSASVRLRKLALPRLVSAFATTSRFSWSASVLWASVWGYGDSFWPAEVLAYSIFSIWQVVDLITLWCLNQELILNDEEERTIGAFGQVLPLVLILSILVSAVDAFCGDKKRTCSSTGDCIFKTNQHHV